MEKCGVQLKHRPVSVAAAHHVAEKVAEKLPEATIVKEEVASQEGASQEVSSQKRRKRKHHHSQEHREE